MDLIDYHIQGLDWNHGSPQCGERWYGRWLPLLALAATAFAGTFAVWLIFYFILFRWDGHKLVRQLLVLSAMLSYLFLIWLPVGWFRMRNSWLVGCVAFLSSLAASLAAIPTALFLEFTPEELREAWESKVWEDELFLLSIFGFIVFMVPFLTAAYAFQRARRPFSKKSGEWLKSYTVRKRFVIDGDAGEIDRVTVDDVLGAAITTRKNNSYRMVFYLDCIADGEHKIGLFYKRRMVFFTLKPRRNNPKLRYIPVDKLQVARLAEKFGPIKRDFFFAILHLVK